LALFIVSISYPQQLEPLIYTDFHPFLPNNGHGASMGRCGLPANVHTQQTATLEMLRFRLQQSVLFAAAQLLTNTYLQTKKVLFEYHSSQKFPVLDTRARKRLYQTTHNGRQQQKFNVK
jgi:hypothetical protein